MDYTINSFLAPMAQPPRRTSQFSVSLMVHGAALMALALIPLTHPEIITKRPASTYLVMPVLTEYQPPAHVPEAPKIKMPTAPVTRVEPVQVAKLEVPKAIVREKPVEPPKLQPVKFDPVVSAPAPVKAKLAKQVQTGVLSEGSSAKPTIKAPIQKVQTGGFGDENGINGEGKKDSRVLIAHLGSPDLPFGGGYGNGTAGAHGMRGAVASAGFGSSIATSVAEGHGRGSVQAGGFGDATTVASAPKARVRNASGSTTPVEIVFKPRPVYTAEGRQLKIEGEVLLNVMFLANGSLRVENVARGLGHGLDEAAIRAAQQIKFHAATRDGQPYDTEAVLHIVFELAY